MGIRARPAGLAAALVIAATFALRADADPVDPDAELQVQLGTALFEDLWHPTAAGFRLAADVTADGLRRAGLVN